MDPEEPEAAPPITIRPRNYESVKPYTDLLDRQYAHTFNPFVLLELGVRQGMAVDPVPGEFWSLQVDDAGFTVADVACPCGEQPRVEACGMTVCGCERAFVFTGQDVTVVNSQKRVGADSDAAA